MNWTTGAFSVQPISVKLFGVGATTSLSGFEPWMLSFSIPVFAILILAGVIGRPRKVEARTAPEGS